MPPLDHFDETHLSIRTFSLLPGEEWSFRPRGWLMLQIEKGSGHWLQAQSGIELETETVLLTAGNHQKCVRASTNGMSVRGFQIMPTRLAGLITSGEQAFFRRAALRREWACQIFPARHPVAEKMRTFLANPVPQGLLSKVALLRLFVEAFGKELKQTVSSQENTDAKARLQTFLQDVSPDALLEISFDKLAQLTRCTPRHLSRIFHDLEGASFREKRAEIRLRRARALLTTSRSKVIDIALESGYKSLSLFNLMFARRFGTSPARWRQRYGANQRVKLDKVKTNPADSF